MTELQGAVALAQIEKLEKIVRSRPASAATLTELIAGLLGVSLPVITSGGQHVYWKYPLRIDGDRFRGGLDGVSASLRERGVYSAPRYIQKPAFQCAVIRDRVTFGRSRWPWSAREDEPPRERVSDYPGTFDALSRVLVLPWNERYTTEHVEYIASGIISAVHTLGKE
jgi:dTDP-4-amino-4,6-dideoxygalactose transaminase